MIPSYKTIVRKAFDTCPPDLYNEGRRAFILEHNYNADQSRFLRAVHNVFLQRRKLEVGDLYEPPLSNFGENALERLFSHAEINDLIELAKRLAA